MTTIPASSIVSVLPNVLNAGGSALDLIAVVLTKSNRVPIGTDQSFPSAAAVGQYFGFTSNEYAIAVVYFGGFTGATTVASAILFTQYPATAVPAYVRSGKVAALPLSALQSLAPASLTVVIDGYTHTSPNIDLSQATSFSAAAALVQAGLTATEPTECSFTGSIAGNTLTVSAVTSGTISVGQTVVGTNVPGGTVVTALGTGEGLAGTYTVSTSETVASAAMTTQATPLTVAFDSVSGAFVVTSGVTGTASEAAFASGPLATPLLLTSVTGAVLSQGAPAAAPGAFMDALTNVTQDFATFMTAFDPDNGSGNAVKLAFAAWTSAQNKRYAYVCWDTDVTPTASSSATQSLGYLLQQNNYDGTFLIWEPASATPLYHAAFVCGVAAAINYNTLNGRITFAFRAQAGLIASVTSLSVANNLIANGYNFYGAYATAKQGFVFLYPGSVTGEFEWMDSYVNEIWLNNGLQLAGLELLTQVNSIPYNAEGYALFEAALQDPINEALNNGVIRAGVPLSDAQATEINTAIGFKVDNVVTAQGYYLYIGAATPQVRQARGTPPAFLYYTDGESIQKLTLASVNVQ